MPRIRRRRTYGIQDRIDPFRQDTGKPLNLGGVSIVVVEHPTEPLAPPDRAGASRVRRIGDDQPVTESLMMAFKMIMRGKFLNRFPQCIFPEHDHSVEARLLYGPYQKGIER